MSKRIVTTAYWKGDDLIFRHKGKWLEAMKALKGEIRVTGEKQTRSLKQNDLMWAWWEIVKDSGSDFEGWTKNDVHRYAMWECNRVTKLRVNRKTGEIEEVSFGGGSSEMAMDALAEVLTRCQQFFAETHGIVLPSDESDWLEYEIKKEKRRRDARM